MTTPALPDSVRAVVYTISSSVGPFAVNFQIYGDLTDYDNWIQVYLNGIRYLSTDPTFGWTLTSPSGSLGLLPRPIVDGVINFNSAQTGTLEIIGAQRPRRLSEFAENTGVPAASFNVLFNSIFAELREGWDRAPVVSNFAGLGAGFLGRVAILTDGLAANCADGSCTTWGTVVTAGGGALKLLIWYNGTNWTLIGK